MATSRLGPKCGSEGALKSASPLTVVRRIKAGMHREDPPAIYLTFDDGPDAIGTPRVLDLLDRHGIRVTFFLVATQARNHPDIVRRILKSGHTIGNHSFDHSYGIFFQGFRPLLEWVKRSEEEFRSLGIATIGFRPPAGVRTPHLHQALRQLDIPLVLWHRRFFDTVRPFSRLRAERAARRDPPGSIVLLHDRQKPHRLPGFLEALDVYIGTVKRRGLQFRALTVSNCKTPERNHP